MAGSNRLRLALLAPVGVRRPTSRIIGTRWAETSGEGLPQRWIREESENVKTLDLENHFSARAWVDAMFANKEGSSRLVKAPDGVLRIYHVADPHPPHRRDHPQFHTYGMGMAGPSFGFGAETTMVMMRLIVSGAFNAFPKLKIVLGTDFPFEDMRRSSR